MDSSASLRFMLTFKLMQTYCRMPNVTVLLVTVDEKRNDSYLYLGHGDYAMKPSMLIYYSCVFLTMHFRAMMELIAALQMRTRK